MPKNVVLARPCTLVLGDDVLRPGDPAVISDEVYDAHSEWWQVIEDVPDVPDEGIDSVETPED